jgi:hypothetical protein
LIVNGLGLRQGKARASEGFDMKGCSQPHQFTLVPGETAELYTCIFDAGVSWNITALFLQSNQHGTGKQSSA